MRKAAICIILACIFACQSEYTPLTMTLSVVIGFLGMYFVTQKTNKNENKDCESNKE